MNPISNSTLRSPADWERRAVAFETKAYEARRNGKSDEAFREDAITAMGLAEIRGRVVTSQNFLDARDYFQSRELLGDATFCTIAWLKAQEGRRLSLSQIQKARESLEAGLLDESTPEFRTHQRSWAFLTAELLSEEADLSYTSSRKMELHERARALYDEYEHFAEAFTSAFNVADSALQELRIDDARSAIEQMNVHASKVRIEELEHHELLAVRAFDSACRNIEDESNRAVTSALLDLWEQELLACSSGNHAEVSMTMVMTADSIMEEADQAVNTRKFHVETAEEPVEGGKALSDIPNFAASVVNVAWFASEIYARAAQPDHGLERLDHLRQSCGGAMGILIRDSQPEAQIQAGTLTRKRLDDISRAYARQWNLTYRGL